jgi:hypothetical protein
MGVQKHQKKRFAKEIVLKSVYKKIDEKSKPVFLYFLITVLGVSQ